jgi:hypothetical protein
MKRAPPMPIQATPPAIPAVAPPFVFFLVDEVVSPVKVGLYREVEVGWYREVEVLTVALLVMNAPAGISGESRDVNVKPPGKS